MQIFSTLISKLSLYTKAVKQLAKNPNKNAERPPLSLPSSDLDF